MSLNGIDSSTGTLVCIVAKGEAVSKAKTSTNGEDIIQIKNSVAKFEFKNISDKNSTDDILMTYSPVENGDSLVIITEDNTIHEMIASGVTGSSPYTIDTASVTSGETPTLAYHTTEAIEFNNEQTEKLPTQYSKRKVLDIDPFNDGSLVSMYRFNNAFNDDLLRYPAQEIGSVPFVDTSLFGRGIIIHNETNSYRVETSPITETINSFSFSVFVDGDTGDDGAYYYAFKSGDAGVYLLVNEDYIEISLGRYQDAHYTKIDMTDYFSSLHDSPLHIIMGWDKKLNDGYPYLYIKNLITGDFQYFNTKTCSVVNEKRDAHNTVGVDPIFGIAGINSSYTGRRKVYIGQIEIYDKLLALDECNLLSFIARDEIVLDGVVSFKDKSFTPSSSVKTKVKMSAVGNKMTELSFDLYTQPDDEA